MHRYLPATGLALALVLAACGRDDAEPTATVNAANSATPGAGPIASRPDGALITLRGTVVSTTPNSFILDYREGRAIVEMDDWDWFQEGRALRGGEEVVVNGRVDRDLWERGAIEARSVYVEGLGAYFYANDADEEEISGTVVLAPSEGATDVSGTVTAAEGREFTVGTGTGAVRVDTAEMQRNPMEGDGSRRVAIGDRVYAWGRLDIDAGEADELMAQGVVKLLADSKKKEGAAQ